MRALFPLRLALRLWRPRDAVELVGAVSIAFGGALIVLSLGVVLALGGELAHRQAVLLERTPAAAHRSVAEASALTSSEDYDVGGLELLRLELSPSRARAPLGLTRWPRPGEVFASPAARRLMAHNSYAAALVPGRVTGTVSRAGLRDPDEAYVVVGRSRRDLAADPDAQAFEGFSAQSSISQDVTPQGLLRALFLCAAMLAGAAAVLLTTVTRLAGRARSRRIAVLQLLGASTRTVRAVAGWTAAGLAASGSLLGALLVQPLSDALARRGIEGVHWWTGGRWVESDRLMILVVVTTLALAITARRTVDPDPWRVRRLGAERKGPILWPLALGLGVCLLSGVLVGEWRNGPHDAGLTGGPTILLALALILVFLAVPLSAPSLLRWVSMAASRSQALALRLAAARTAHQPRSIARLAAATMVIVLSAGMTTGVWAIAQARYRGAEAGGRLALSLASVPGTTWPQREAKDILRRRDLVAADVTRAPSASGSGYGPLTTSEQIRLSDLGWDFILPAHTAVGLAASIELRHPGQQPALFDHEQSGPRATVLVSALVLLAQLAASVCVISALAVSLLTIQSDRSAPDAALLKAGMGIWRLRSVRLLEMLLCLLPAAVLASVLAGGIAHAIAHVDDPVIAVPLGPLMLAGAMTVIGSLALGGIAAASTRRLDERALRSQ